jgi:hypothetical protein
MSDHRNDGWNLWAKNLIAAAMADERKVLLESVADAIGRAIAVERQREFQARAQLEIAITDLQTLVAGLEKSIAELLAEGRAQTIAAVELPAVTAAVKH